MGWLAVPRDWLGSLGDIARFSGKVMGLVYTAVEGASSGLPLFESIGLLGRERALHRLRAARSRLAGA